MLKRLTVCLLCLLLLFSVAASEEETAIEAEDSEDISQVSEDVVREIEELDAIEDDEPVYIAGEMYHEMDKESYNAQSQAIYTARTIRGTYIYSDRSIESPKLVQKDDSSRVDVLYVGVNWCIVRLDDKIGYIKRERLTAIVPVDPVNTPPYGTQKASYIAVTATDAHVRKSMSAQDENWVVLKPGTRISLWRIQNGWGIVIYMRSYGYIDMNELTNLIPVSPTDTPIAEDTPIAAYTSFYKMVETEANIGRIHNIGHAASRLCRTLEAGESLNYNKQIGPFNPQNGYKKAPVLVDGKTVLGSGGGVCQVSSTLYNALLQLPGITVLQRRAHGPSGASYLPHGVDAASGGGTTLNLRFRNDYSFPVRIDMHSESDGALYVAIYRAD